MAAAWGTHAERQQCWEGWGATKKLKASESIAFPTCRAGAVPPCPLLLWLFPKSSQIAPKTPLEYRPVIHNPTFLLSLGFPPPSGRREAFLESGPAPATVPNILPHYLSLSCDFQGVPG